MSLTTVGYGDVVGATDLGGPSDPQDLPHELLTIDENTERFPFLYYFLAEDAAASVPTLMRGSDGGLPGGALGRLPGRGPLRPACTETSCSGWCARLGMTAPTRPGRRGDPPFHAFRGAAPGARRSLTTWPAPPAASGADPRRWLRAARALTSARYVPD